MIENDANKTKAPTIAELEQDVGETKNAIVDKLQKMEDRLRSTVGEAKGLVDTATGAIEKVKNGMDLKKQVQEHPIGMFAGVMVAGAVVAAGVHGMGSRRRFREDGDLGPSDDGSHPSIAGEVGRILKRLALTAALGFLKTKAVEWIEERSASNGLQTGEKPKPQSLVH